jgi:hypothetical protein
VEVEWDRVPSYCCKTEARLRIQRWWGETRQESLAVPAPTFYNYKSHSSNWDNFEVRHPSCVSQNHKIKQHSLEVKTQLYYLHTHTHTHTHTHIYIYIYIHIELR